LLSVLTRSFPGIFSHFFEINEKEIASKIKTNQLHVTNQLKELEKFGLIDINWKSNLPTVTLLHERLPNDYINLSTEVYSHRKQVAFDRLSSVIDFLKDSNVCRQKKILNYFNQVSNDCGHCDICMSKKTKNSLNGIENEILNSLGKNQTLNELFSIINRPEKDIILAIQQLILSEKVFENNGTYCKKQ
jgi:ATP-dependent DNA helicase RecQ